MAKTDAKLGIDRPIVLVGLMGAGKTSIGRRLARRLALDFVDADTEVETAAGLTIPDIFEAYGEAAFRDCEKRVIARLLDASPRVIATGGGAFVDDETRRRIKDKAVSVWLRAPVPLLVERVVRRGNRPLLQDRDPEAVLRQLSAERNPCYAEADIAVDSGEGPHEQVVEAILESLRDYAADPNHARSAP